MGVHGEYFVKYEISNKGEIRLLSWSSVARGCLIIIILILFFYVHNKRSVDCA